MVLTDDNYASIVAAIEQDRVIYANIRKFVFFLLSSNVAEIMVIFLATLAGLPVPLTAIQLLWLNLLTDGAPALALAMFLQPIFNTHAMASVEWAFVLGLALIPAVAEEITKFFLRRLAYAEAAA